MWSVNRKLFLGTGLSKSETGTWKPDKKAGGVEEPVDKP